MNSLNLLANTLFGLFLSIGLVSFHYITKFLFLPLLDISAIPFISEQRNPIAIAVLSIPYRAYFSFSLVCILLRSAWFDLSSFEVIYICFFPAVIECIAYLASIFLVPINLNFNGMKNLERNPF